MKKNKRTNKTYIPGMPIIDPFDRINEQIDTHEDRIREIEGFLSYIGSPAWEVRQRLDKLEAQMRLKVNKLEWKWVLPKDRLPRHESSVLVTVHKQYNDKLTVEAATYFFDTGFWTSAGQVYEATDPKLVAWSYLPKPYEGSKK